MIGMIDEQQTGYPDMEMWCVDMGVDGQIRRGRTKKKKDGLRKREWRSRDWGGELKERMKEGKSMTFVIYIISPRKNERKALDGN